MTGEGGTSVPEGRGSVDAASLLSDGSSPHCSTSDPASCKYTMMAQVLVPPPPMWETPPEPASLLGLSQPQLLQPFAE